MFTSIHPPPLEREKTAIMMPLRVIITEIDGKVCIVVTITHLRLGKLGGFDSWMLDCHSQKWIPMYNIKWPPGLWSIHPAVFIHRGKVSLQDIADGLYCYDLLAKNCQLESNSVREVPKQNWHEAAHAYFYKKTLVALEGYAASAIARTTVASSSRGCSLSRSKSVFEW